jgi:prevent-host-death family protein
MKRWAVQDAKSRFSEFLDTCLRDGPQVVTRRGAEAAVLVPIEDWKRLSSVHRPSLKEWLLAEQPRFELPYTRRKVRHRAPPRFR